VKQLRLGVLAGLFIVAGVLSWGGARLWEAFATLPSVPLAAPIVLAVIAVILAATALSLRARLRAQRERRPGAKGVEPLMAARAVVFGQASALVAALVSGMYGGTGVFLLGSLDIPARRDQAIYAGFSLVAGIAVIAAAFFLERVCKLPEDENGDKGAASA
jgi:phosphatidylglycerophosphate synthase